MKLEITSVILTLGLCVSSSEISVSPQGTQINGTTLTTPAPKRKPFSDSILSVMYHTYKECLPKNTINCLKIKVLTGMDRILHGDDIPIVQKFIVLERSPNADDIISEEPLTEKQVLSNLPRDAEDSGKRLDSLLYDRISKFVGTRNLKMSLQSFFPGISLSVSRNDGDVDAVDLGLEIEDEFEENVGETGRKKLKKLLLPILIGLKLKYATLIPIALGALALISGKALVVSLLSLVLSAVVGLKKISSNESSTYEIVSYPQYSHSYGHGGHKRSFQGSDGDLLGQSLSYRGYRSPQHSGEATNTIRH